MLNGLYITIGGALLALLVAALIGPYVIDWSYYKENFELRASRIIGQKVVVNGDASASILPMPSLTFSDVVVGEDMMSVEQFSARVELLPLISGELRVVDMTLTKPRMNVTFDEQGKLAWTDRQSTGELDPKSVILEQVQVENGIIIVNDARHDREFVFDEVNVAVQARSLFGPFKLDGSARLDDHAFSINLATGELLPDGRLRMKSDVLPVALPVAFSTDGFVSLPDTGLQYEGELRGTRIVDDAVEGEAGDAPLAVDGSYLFTADQFFMPDLNLVYGQPDQTYTLGGAITVDLGSEPRFSAVLSARQIDLDRSIGSGAGSPANMAKTLAAFSEGMAGLPDFPLPGRIEMRIPSIVLGGGIVQQFQVAAASHPDGWTIELIEAAFPGRADLSARGMLTTAGALSFSGEARLDADRPSAFAAWLRSDETLRSRIGRLQMAGDVSVSATAMAIENLAMGLGDSRGTGSLDWQFGTANAPVEFNFNLNADSLNIDGLRSMLALLGTGQGSAGISLSDAISIDIAAQELVARSARFNDVAFAAELASGNLNVSRFRVGDGSGGLLEASGSIKNIAEVPDGALRVSVAAAETAGFRELLRALAQDGLATSMLSSIADRLDQFAPLSLMGELTATAQDEESDISLTVNGTGAESKFDVRFSGTGRVDKPRDATVDLEIKASNPQTYELLSQIGFDVLPVEGLGPARLMIKTQGQVETGLELQADIRIAGVDMGAAGQLLIAPDYRVDPQLELVVQTENIADLLLLKGIPLPGDALQVPLDFATSLRRVGEVFDLKDISGRSADTTFAGDLTVSAPDALTVGGSMTFSAMDLIWMLGLGLGPSAFEIAPGIANPWSASAFTPPLLGEIEIDLDLQADAIRLPLLGLATKPGLKLTYRPDGIKIDDFSSTIGGGTVGGNISIENRSGNVRLVGRGQVDGLDLNPYIWTDGRRPVASGQLGVTMEVDGQGRSVTGIVSSLAGGGTMQITDGRLRRINPTAFNSVIQAADQGVQLDEERIRELFTGFLDAGALDFSLAEGVFTISDGEIRAGNIAVTSDKASTRGDVRMDLNNWQMRSNWSIEIDPGNEAVAGATPEVGVIFEGPIHQPTRRLDVTPLTGFLTLRSFEREVRKVEALQASIFEAERLDRELKLIDVFKERRERRRIAEEARLKAEEEARQKAEAERLAREAAAAAAEAERLRKAEEARLAAQAAEQARLDEEARLAAEAAERARIAEEARQLAIEEQALRQQQAEEKARAAEEARRAAEQARIEEARKLAEQELNNQQSEDEIGTLLSTLPDPKPDNPVNTQNALESLRRQLEQQRGQDVEVLDYQILNDPALRPTQGVEN